MRRPSVLVSAIVAGLLLGGCSSPSDESSPHSDEPQGDHEESPTTTPGRQGWRVGATNVLGSWIPQDVCGGDYVFVVGVGLHLEESLVGLDGTENYSGPLASLKKDNYRDGWGYWWYANDAVGEYAPGDFIEGLGRADFKPDANGHPPASVTFSGGTHSIVADDLGSITVRGADSMTFTFERIPEPDWCLEDEEYVNDPANDASEWAWTYYD